MTHGIRGFRLERRSAKLLNQDIDLIEFAIDIVIDTLPLALRDGSNKPGTGADLRRGKVGLGRTAVNAMNGRRNVASATYCRRDPQLRAVTVSLTHD